MPVDDFNARVAVKLDRLERWCEQHDVPVTPAGEVTEPDACFLMSYESTKTLAHQSAEGRLPATLRRRRVGPKWVYTIDSIAFTIVLQEQNGDA